MEILEINYTGKNTRTLHLLYLGSHNEKLCGIDILKINPSERSKILAGLETLISLTGDKRYHWLKVHCPSAIKTGYKEIHIKNAAIVKRIPVSFT